LSHNEAQVRRWIGAKDGGTVAASSIDPHLLLSYLGADAEQRLKDYFLGSEVFTGRWFERLAGGGDRSDARDRFSAEDLVAVTFLSVDVPPVAAWSMLEGRPEDLNKLLRAIPSDQDLWNVPPDVIDEDSAANRLWHELDDLEGVGWVTAGKLMARKRPRLIPIYDDVVRNAFDLEKGIWWKAMRDVLADNPDIVLAATQLRSDSGIGDEISILRVIDVAIWTKDRRHHHT
jgi:hypothetical protein